MSTDLTTKLEVKEEDELEILPISRLDCSSALVSVPTRQDDPVTISDEEESNLLDAIVISSSQ